MESLKPNPLVDFPPNVLNQVRKYYDLDVDKINQSIEIIDKWAQMQPHFRNKNFERERLERILISCKGSVEKAKIRIEKLCTYRTLVPYFFITKVKEELGPTMEHMCINIVPKMTKDYQRIYLIKFNEKVLKVPNIEMTSFLVNMVTIECLYNYDYANGFIIVEDLRELSIAEVMSSMRILELQRYIMILIEGYGAKMTSMHFLSNSKLIDSLITLVKKFLKEKIAKRIFVHQNTDTLVEKVGAEYLPKEYGGTEYTMDGLKKKWMDYITSDEFSKYLERMNTYCTDESLRPKDKYNDEYASLTGSFRTLNVD